MLTLFGVAFAFIVAETEPAVAQKAEYDKLYYELKNLSSAQWTAAKKEAAVKVASFHYHYWLDCVRDEKAALKSSTEAPRDIAIAALTACRGDETQTRKSWALAYRGTLTSVDAERTANIRVDTEKDLIADEIITYIVQLRADNRHRSEK